MGKNLKRMEKISVRPLVLYEWRKIRYMEKNLVLVQFGGKRSGKKWRNNFAWVLSLCEDGDTDLHLRGHWGCGKDPGPAVHRWPICQCGSPLQDPGPFVAGAPRQARISTTRSGRPQDPCVCHGGTDSGVLDINFTGLGILHFSAAGFCAGPRQQDIRRHVINGTETGPQDRRDYNCNNSSTGGHRPLL